MADGSLTGWTGGGILARGDARLTNPDLVPVPVEQRRWTWWHFGTLWMGMVHNIFNFTWIGGLVAVGISIPQALAIAIVGSLIQAALIGFTGKVGARHGIPFAVWGRSAFGVYGTNVIALLRGAVAIGWFGVQSYLAALAINVLLRAAIPAWRGLDHTVVLGLAANFWIAMVIYWLFNFLIIRHGMETVRRFEVWAGPLVFVVMFALVVWAVGYGGGIGPIFASPSRYSTGEYLVHQFVPGVALFIAGSWATMVLNMPDLTRFARSNREQFWGTMLGLPLAQTVYYVMASVIVSATLLVFHKALWNPPDVLQAIDNPGLSIFGALLLAVASLSVNIPANIVSPAYDLTNLLTRWLTFRRGAVISIVIAFAYAPWRLMQTPQALFSVLDNIGVVLGPATGILIADYFVVRRQRLDVPGLFDRHGPYRAVGGFNPVGLGVLIASWIPLFVGEVVPQVGFLYKNAWFVGVLLGFLGYLAAVGLVGAVRRGLPPELQALGDEGVEAGDLRGTAPEAPARA
jgi:NCS1 family nucleobase:cation symporter-1